MKLLFDFFPIILFFAAFKLWDIYVATAVAIAATVVQIGWLLVRRKKIDAMKWVSLALIVVFGGATILLHNENLIKWKLTALYWLMGCALVVGQLVFKKNLLKTLMGAELKLPDPVWRVLTFSWAGFFLVMGMVNLWVAFHLDTNSYVNFKLFGSIGMTIVFTIGQFLYLAKYLPDDAAAPAKIDAAQPGGSPEALPREAGARKV